MVRRRARILLGLLGEGGRESLLKLAKGLSEAGFEVVYTDLTEPRAIVTAALQEAVDHVGLALMRGTRSDAVLGVVNLLKSEGIMDITVSAGGDISYKEADRLRKGGVLEVFPLAISREELIDWCRTHLLGRAGEKG